MQPNFGSNSFNCDVIPWWGNPVTLWNRPFVEPVTTWQNCVLPHWPEHIPRWNGLWQAHPRVLSPVVKVLLVFLRVFFEPSPAQICRCTFGSPEGPIQHVNWAYRHPEGPVQPDNSVNWGLPDFKKGTVLIFFPF